MSQTITHTIFLAQAQCSRKAFLLARGESLHTLTEGPYHWGPMVRVLALTYGAVSYLAFLAVFGVLVGFLANVDLVRAIDGGPIEALPVAVAIDVGLVALFGVSHSVMARPWFKLVWVRLVPRAAERSTYVLVASLILALLAWQWRAIAETVWNVEPPIARVALSGISCAGIILLVVSTFLTDHLDLFGVRQVWLYASGRPYSPVPFREQSLYRYVRHPMMIGFLLWFWATPTMSVGRLIFVLAMTLYVFIGVALEERDLAQHLGEPYCAYRDRVGAFIPRLRLIAQFLAPTDGCKEPACPFRCHGAQRLARIRTENTPMPSRSIEPQPFRVAPFQDGPLAVLEEASRRCRPSPRWRSLRRTVNALMRGVVEVSDARIRSTLLRPAAANASPPARRSDARHPRGTLCRRRMP